MIIVSDCLTDKADEGIRKIASKLAKNLREWGAEVILLNRTGSFADRSYSTGKTGMSFRLIRDLWKCSGNILFIPNASMTIGVCAKTLALRWSTGKKVFLLPVMKRKMNRKMRWLLRLSGAELIVLSQNSFDFYSSQIPNRIHYIQAGVDTERFRPVTAEEKRNLRVQLGFDPDKLTVLHVGHMVESRNTRTLTRLDPNFQIVLLISTSTRWDENVYRDLCKSENIRIIHEYIPNVEQYYQMADVYYFPPQERGCVDVPLSVLEACASGVPVVTTEYGELMNFTEGKGFAFLRDFDTSNALINRVVREGGTENRQKVLPYDWKQAAQKLVRICDIEA